MENAPGPRRPIPTAVATRSSIARCPPRRVGEASGSQEKVMPSRQSTTSRLASGVTNPITKPIPPLIKAPAASHTITWCSLRPEAQRTPRAVAMPPTATRSKRSPMPGLPPGNVEKSRCSASLPIMGPMTTTLLKYRNLAERRNPAMRNFLLPLSGDGLDEELRVRAG